MNMILTPCPTAPEPPRTIAATDKTAELVGACCGSSPAACNAQLHSTVTPLALLGALGEPSSEAGEARPTRPVPHADSPPHEQRGGGVSEEGRALEPTAQPVRGNFEEIEGSHESRACSEPTILRCGTALAGASDERGDAKVQVRPPPAALSSLLLSRPPAALLPILPLL